MAGASAPVPPVVLPAPDVPGAPTAPGQIALAPLYDAIREYSPAFAASHPARAPGTS